MYNCRKCGHALPSNSALCPNCGAMMDSKQLAIKKSLANSQNAYLEKLESIKNKNIMNRNEETSNTNIVGYAIFIIAIFLVIAFIIGFAILRRI